MSTLETNKHKAILGLASVGALYVFPGDYQILSSVTLIYSGFKGYQAV